MQVAKHTRAFLSKNVKSLPFTYPDVFCRSAKCAPCATLRNPVIIIHGFRAFLITSSSVMEADEEDGLRIMSKSVQQAVFCTLSCMSAGMGKKHETFCQSHL